MAKPTSHATLPIEPTERGTTGELTRTFSSASSVTQTRDDGSFEPPIEAGLLPPQVASPWERYEDLGRIGEGGMGEVRRVRDRVMGRVLAIKFIHPEAGESPVLRARFLAEARLTACLAHPGIVPVHDCGALPDGGLWFTMKEVRGRTFRHVVHDLHRHGAPSPAALWGALELYLRVCEAVAYAHVQGVIHRDLKPDNVMVGEFGEVLVMDWGIGRPAARSLDDEPSVEASSDISSDDLPRHTQTGQILGTPAYMPPEQARGEIDRMGPPSDVYALGAILYEMLCGEAPYDGSSMAIWAQVLHQPPPPLGARCKGMIPADLVISCERAMAREPSARPRDAGILAEEIRGFLNGMRRRERALALVEEARSIAPRVEALRALARDLREQSRVVLARLQLFDAAEEKARGWALEDEARTLELSATLDEVAWQQKLHAALGEDPELPEAHADLADAHLAQLRAAEVARDAEAAARAEALLRSHDRGRHAAVLRGDGALTLVTDPEGALVELFRYTERGRRLVAEPAGVLGRTPLSAPLPGGSYLLELTAEGRRKTRYPVTIGRGERWEGVRPRDAHPFVVPLPRDGELDDDDIYVPAGWFWSGGDPLATESLPGRRLWLDGFVLRRHPVTQTDYLAFLNDLVERGREREALAACPHAGGSIAGNVDIPLFTRDAGGRFQPGSHTPEEHGRHPISSVSWRAAVAYAGWWSERTHRPWRLAGELEREKAARGVDGRFMPWGDQPEPTWACVLGSRPGAPSQAPVDDYPVDESPYGVRGLAGNVRDWCIEAWTFEGPPVVRRIARTRAQPGGDPSLRSIRGGSWSAPPAMSRAAGRFASRPEDVFRAVGFRLARPF